MTGLEALEKAREKIAALDLAHFLYLDRFISLGSFQKTILNTVDEMIAAEHDHIVDADKMVERERLPDAGETKPEPGAYREAAMAYQDLATCYRLGTRPSEKLFSRIEKARELLSEPVFEEHDRYVYDDAKPESAKPEPGDVVAWPNPPHGHMMIGLYGRDWTSDIGLVVLMRAAEVRARIEGEK